MLEHKVTAQNIDNKHNENRHGRYKRGYSTDHLPEHVQVKLKKFKESSPVRSAFEALLTVASIPIAAALMVLGASWLFNATDNALMISSCGAVLYILIATFIARQQRGLELMVHDASHLAWWRSNPKMNNLLGNILVAYPVLSSVRSYWKSHRVHHAFFGSHLDPCRQRFEAMGLSNLDLSTRFKIVRAVIKWLPSYNVAYYKEIGSLSVEIWAGWAVWHLCVLLLPCALILHLSLAFEPLDSVALSLTAWCVFWAIPATGILPVIRSIAESEEHDYENGLTEFEATYTNDGLLHRILFHPKNDAYHLVHHLFPSIPECHHKKIHKLLLEEDLIYRAALNRKNVLQH